MTPITYELKQAAGTLDLDAACREIFAGLERGNFYIIPGILRAKTDKIILSDS